MSAPTLDLEINGDILVGFCAHNVSIDNTGLRPCPFCKETDGLEVTNGWAAIYTVACAGCGAEGPHGDPNQPYEEPITDKVLCRRLHQQAHADAVERWNRRFA